MRDKSRNHTSPSCQLFATGVSPRARHCDRCGRLRGIEDIRLGAKHLDFEALRPRS